MANSWSTWFKRWGIWLLLATVTLLVLLSWLLPSVKGKPEILQQAKDDAEKLRSDISKQLREVQLQMDKRRDELNEIKKIADEKERLRKLADFANRKPE